MSCSCSTAVIFWHVMFSVFCSLDFDLFDDEKFKGVCNFVKRHLFTMKGEACTFIILHQTYIRHFMLDNLLH